MKPFKTIYYISRLILEETELKSIAQFQINGLIFRMCLRGYSKEEQQEIEFDHNTVLWDDDNFNEFFFEFFEQFRTILQDYCRMELSGYTAAKLIYSVAVEKAASKEGVEIVEYKKNIRTAYKLVNPAK